MKSKSDYLLWKVIVLLFEEEGTKQEVVRDESRLFRSIFRSDLRFNLQTPNLVWPVGPGSTFSVLCFSFARCILFDQSALYLLAFFFYLSRNASIRGRDILYTSHIFMEWYLCQDRASSRRGYERGKFPFFWKWLPCDVDFCIVSMVPITTIDCVSEQCLRV